MVALVKPDGPIPARIMIVGEAPGADEERLGIPFVGASGQELNRMLHEAGISRSECFVTNVARERPYQNDISNFIAKAKKDVTKDHVLFRDKWVRSPISDGANLLLSEIKSVSPNIIIALGNTPLWALTGKWGITKWRGSMLYADKIPAKVIPTIHPAAVLREWSWRSIAVADLKRAARFRDGSDYPKPAWNFAIGRSFPETVQILENLYATLIQQPTWIDFDLETRHGHIDCAGISWSSTDAICIPFMSRSRAAGHWSDWEEGTLVYLLYKILTHPNALVRGQNLLYDLQYTYRHWLFTPRVKQDTMIAHHVAFAGMKKSLDFQASLYCNYYVQWKPDKSAWKEGG
jgi:uracil-DNA glycosylase